METPTQELINVKSVTDGPNVVHSLIREQHQCFGAETAIQRCSLPTKSKCARNFESSYGSTMPVILPLPYTESLIVFRDGCIPCMSHCNFWSKRNRLSPLMLCSLWMCGTCRTRIVSFPDTSLKQVATTSNENGSCSSGAVRIDVSAAALQHEGGDTMYKDESPGHDDRTDLSPTLYESEEPEVPQILPEMSRDASPTMLEKTMRTNDDCDSKEAPSCFGNFQDLFWSTEISEKDFETMIKDRDKTAMNSGQLQESIEFDLLSFSLIRAEFEGSTDSFAHFNNTRFSHMSTVKNIKISNTEQYKVVGGVPFRYMHPKSSPFIKFVEHVFEWRHVKGVKLLRSDLANAKNHQVQNLFPCCWKCFWCMKQRNELVEGSQAHFVSWLDACCGYGDEIVPFTQGKIVIMFDTGVYPQLVKDELVIAFYDPIKYNVVDEDSSSASRAELIKARALGTEVPDVVLKHILAMVRYNRRLCNSHQITNI